MTTTYEKVKAYYNTLTNNCYAPNTTKVDFRKDGIYIAGERVVYREAIELMDEKSIRGYALAWAHISVKV